MFESGLTPKSSTMNTTGRSAGIRMASRYATAFVVSSILWNSIHSTPCFEGSVT